MFNKITIILERANPYRFRLVGEIEPPRVASAAMVDLATEQPVWWVVPSSFRVSLPMTMGVSENDVELLADSEPLDPIEDLAPSDPRHQAAIAERERMNEEAFPLLESLTFGVVPPGFRQASPEGGVAALVPGRRYSLTVVGRDAQGHIAFHA